MANCMQIIGKYNLGICPLEGRTVVVVGVVVGGEPPGGAGPTGLTHLLALPTT